MKSKKVVILLILVIVILVGLFVSTGLTKISNVYLNNYSVSEDGNTITLRVAVASSMGYVRDINVDLSGTSRYITFYPCFGGFNSSIGAKSEFELEVTSDCDEIYFYHGDGGYDLVLQRDKATNTWQKSK